jgi:hypothetical protein
MTEELKLYSKDQLAVWYYNETLKNKSAKALEIFESYNKIISEVRSSSVTPFTKEFEELLRKYGVLPYSFINSSTAYGEKMLLLNGDLDFLETVRKKCGLDEDGDAILD